MFLIIKVGSYIVHSLRGSMQVLQIYKLYSKTLHMIFNKSMQCTGIVLTYEKGVQHQWSLICFKVNSPYPKKEGDVGHPEPRGV